MTELERDAALMRLIRRNEALREKIAALESEIGTYSGRLVKLAKALDADPSLVIPSQEDTNRFLLTQRDSTPLELDMARLRDLLAELQETVRQKEKIEACMEKGGLTRFIR